jgi:hypothetical protein
MVAFGATAGQAGPAEKTTGSVELSSAMRYISFDAFETTPVKGSVHYTDFATALPGSGVWVPDAFSFFMAVDGSSATGTYAMTVDSYRPTSPTSVRFSGTGVAGGWISTFTGWLSGDDFALQMTEINAGNPSETYALQADGLIAANGSVSGRWFDNYAGFRQGDFAIADIGHEVFSYLAPVTAVDVSSATTASFSYVIPAGIPYAGTPITVSVTDGGSPAAGNDTITINGQLSDDEIMSGNLTVFTK